MPSPSIHSSQRLPSFREWPRFALRRRPGIRAICSVKSGETGWWYFFPVALAVKSTIPFLILVLIGSFYLVRSAWAGQRNLDYACASGSSPDHPSSLPCRASINIGVRHILPIYPLLAIIAGVGACRFWDSAKPKYAGPVIILALLAWQLISSIRAHPDYLAYFNEFAGRHPEKILIDSDLDWGQDLLRLSAALKQRHVRSSIDCLRRQLETGLKQIWPSAISSAAPRISR